MQKKCNEFHVIVASILLFVFGLGTILNIVVLHSVTQCRTLLERYARCAFDLPKQITSFGLNFDLQVFPIRDVSRLGNLMDNNIFEFQKIEILILA